MSTITVYLSSMFYLAATNDVFLTEKRFQFNSSEGLQHTTTRIAKLQKCSLMFEL